MGTADQTFSIRVDDGPEQTITVRTGVYQEAAAAVPALLGLSLPIDVQIWVPALLPQYPGHRFRIRDNQFGQLVVETLVPSPSLFRVDQRRT